MSFASGLWGRPNYAEDRLEGELEAESGLRNPEIAKINSQRVRTNIHWNSGASSPRYGRPSRLSSWPLRVSSSVGAPDGLSSGMLAQMHLHLPNVPEYFLLQHQSLIKCRRGVARDAARGNSRRTSPENGLKARRIAARSSRRFLTRSHASVRSWIFLGLLPTGQRRAGRANRWGPGRGRGRRRC